MLDQKGIASIEFILAVFVFLGSITFTTLATGREFFTVREMAATDTIKIRGLQITQLLLFDRGWPQNWEIGPPDNVKRLGLSAGGMLILDNAKLDALNGFCTTFTNYNKIRDLLGTETDIIIDARTLDGLQSWHCGPSVETQTRPKFPTEGYAVLNTNKKIVKFTVILVA